MNALLDTHSFTMLGPNGPKHGAQGSEGSAHAAADKDTFTQWDSDGFEIRVVGNQAIELVGGLARGIVDVVDPPIARAIDVVGNDQATDGDEGADDFPIGGVLGF